MSYTTYYNLRERPTLVTAADCRAEKNRIEYGDHIYVRVSLNGQTIAEFSSDRFASRSQVVAEIRYITRIYSGLAQVYVRNHSRGWSNCSPLRLYGPSGPERYGKRNAAFRSGHAGTQRQMLFPWETHLM